MRSMRHVADSEGYGHAIEAAIRISELFGVALLEGDNAIKAALGRAFLTHGKHIGIDIAHDDACPGAAGLGNPESDIAGATSQIEHRKFARAFRRVDCLTRASFHARCRPPDIRSFIKS
jgi:hypothetical protein